MDNSNKPLMLVLSSPSGAGKTTLTKKIQESDSTFRVSISHTTRKARANEVDGVDYHFVKKAEFEKLIKDKAFYEHAKIFENLYGTSKSSIKKITEKGHNVLFDIDWQGADQIKNKKLDYKLITFFILPPSKKILSERLSKRHTSDKLIPEERMRQFERDVLHWINYDYVVINDNLSKCYIKIKNLINAEINNDSKDYDPKFIRDHIDKLTS